MRSGARCLGGLKTGLKARKKGDGYLNCREDCPRDPNKVRPGLCGCGSSDADSDGDGVVTESARKTF